MFPRFFHISSIYSIVGRSPLPKCCISDISCDFYFPLFWDVDLCKTHYIKVTATVPTGTIGAIWINGTVGLEIGNEMNVTVCVRNSSSCCSVSWDIRVMKCQGLSGMTFNVYRLRKPPSCPMAYCAGMSSSSLYLMFSISVVQYELFIVT